MSAPRRLVLAGAGAAATGLARALIGQGWTLGRVARRTTERAAERCGQLGAGTPVSMQELATLPPADNQPVLLIVGVPDRLVGLTAEALAARPWPPNSVALHLSGAIEVSALAPLRAPGLAIGGCHPLLSFPPPDRPTDPSAWSGAVLALEGDQPALEAGHDIAHSLGAHPLSLAPGSRAAWHAGAVHAANHLVALVDQSLDLLEQAGLDRDAGRAALVPLLSSTLAQLRQTDPTEALTGPVVRGDIDAVRRHLEALEDVAPDVAAAYRALAQRALGLALTRGLDAETARTLRALLTHLP